MTAKWAIFFYLVPRDPENRTNLDVRAKRVRDEIVRLARKYPRDLRIAYRLAPSGPNPAERVVVGETLDTRMVEDEVYDPGDPTALGKFLRWAHENGCVGQRCAVFFWGHGWGPAGLFSLEDLELLGLVAPNAAPVIAPAQSPQPANAPAAGVHAAYPIVPGLEVRANARFAVIRRPDGIRLHMPAHGIARHHNDYVIYPAMPHGAFAEVPHRTTTTVVNLASGLKTLARLRGTPVDLALFQCCWVSNLESAHQLRGELNAMIGSQTLVPILQNPWPYERLFKVMMGTSSLTEASLKRLTGQLVRILGQWHTLQNQRRPITALNTRDVSVAPAFADLVRALKLTTPAGQALNFEHLYSNAPRRDRKNGLYRTENSGLIDVLRLCEDLQQAHRAPSVIAAARTLEKAVTENLILAHHTPDPKLYRGATVYYQPSQTTIDWLKLPTHSDNASIKWLLPHEYSYLSFVRASKWGAFAFEMDGLTV